MTASSNSETLILYAHSGAL